jgi:hypothetical protein
MMGEEDTKKERVEEKWRVGQVDKDIGREDKRGRDQERQRERGQGRKGEDCW